VRFNVFGYFLLCGGSLLLGGEGRWAAADYFYGRLGIGILLGLVVLFGCRWLLGGEAGSKGLKVEVAGVGHRRRGECLAGLRGNLAGGFQS